jgi:hypothetical protein
MEKNVPKVKEKNTVNAYINDKIKNLQKQKNKILTKIHHSHRNWPKINTRKIDDLKTKLNDIRDKLKIEFSKSINEYWKNKITKISTKSSASMFPQLNSIFRKKELAQIDTLKIPPNSPILNSAELDMDQVEKDEDGNILVNSLQDKLNVMGAYFASINNRKQDNHNRSRLNEIINKETTKFKDKTKIERNNNTTNAHSAIKTQLIIPIWRMNTQTTSSILYLYSKCKV